MPYPKTKEYEDTGAALIHQDSPITLDKNYEDRFLKRNEQYILKVAFSFLLIFNIQHFLHPIYTLHVKINMLIL